MKTGFIRSIISLTLAFLVYFVATPIIMADLPPLPKDLKKMAQQFPPLEEAFRQGKWEKAQGHLKEIRSHYASILSDLLKATNDSTQRKKVTHFGFLLKNLDKQLAFQEQEKAEKSFHLFGGLIVEFINLFSYPEHPLLTVFAKKSEKMMKGAKAGKLPLSRIATEMTAMGSMLKRMEASLLQRGVHPTKIQETFQQLDRVQKLASANNKEAIHQQLKVLQQLFLEIK